MLAMECVRDGKEFWEDQTQEQIIRRVVDHGEVVSMHSINDACNIVEYAQRMGYEILFDPSGEHILLVPGPKVYEQQAQISRFAELSIPVERSGRRLTPIDGRVAVEMLLTQGFEWKYVGNDDTWGRYESDTEAVNIIAAHPTMIEIFTK